MVSQHLRQAMASVPGFANDGNRQHAAHGWHVHLMRRLIWQISDMKHLQAQEQRCEAR